MNNVKVIQTSPPRTGSTLLLNLIHGFLSPNEKIHWDEHVSEIDDYFISKTHVTDIDIILNKYKQYKLYFVVSERNDSKVKGLIVDKYRKYYNVLIINYNEINVTNELSFDNVIDNIFDKFIQFFPLEIVPKKKDILIKADMKKRIVNMNKIVEEIKNKPFSYWDRFYGIHGSHRNRK